MFMKQNVTITISVHVNNNYVNNVYFIQNTTFINKYKTDSKTGSY